MTINDAPMNLIHKYFGIGNTLRYTSNYFFVTLAVSIRHIIAKPDVTPLHDSIQFRKLAVNFIVKIVNTTVILPKLLDTLRWYKTTANQILEHTLSNPLGIFNITLMTRQLFNKIGIYKFQLEMRFKDSPNRNPVDTCALHSNLLNMMLEHQITHFRQFEC